MHESPGPLGQVAEQLPTLVRSWAFAVNTTVDCSDIEITLLSFVVVGEFARVTGLVRIRNRPDVRLASVPELSLTTVDGSPLATLSAHVLPHGDMAWVSWLYRRPPHVFNEYEGHIDVVNLDQRARGRDPGRISHNVERGWSASGCRRLQGRRTCLPRSPIDLGGSHAARRSPGRSSRGIAR